MPEHFTLGFLGGTGPQGRGLAFRLALAGHEVLLGSRDEGRAKNVVKELLGGRGLPIRGVSNQQAANKAEALFVVVPYDGQATLLPALAPPLAEKIVVNMINPLTRDAHGLSLRPVPEGSAAEQAQQLLPESRVVAAFHHAPPRLLLDQSRDVDTDVLVCGDDPAAKAWTISRADEISGMRGVDAGPLRLARHLEGFTALLVSINIRYKIHAGVRVTRLSESRRLSTAAPPAGTGRP